MGNRYVGYTPVCKAASEKYRAQFKYIRVQVEPGRLEFLKGVASDAGESLSGWLNRLIDQDLVSRGIAPDSWYLPSHDDEPDGEPDSQSDDEPFTSEPQEPSEASGKLPDIDPGPEVEGI